MIYGSSKDPVLIKKISLRVWTLRDEIESVIRARGEANPTELQINDLIAEYRSSGIFPDSGEGTEGAADGDDGVKDASELDDFGEDEMAKALAEAEAEEAAAADGEASEGDAEGEESEGEEGASEGDAESENSEEAGATVLEIGFKPDDSGSNVVKQRVPKLSQDKIFSGRAILSEIYMDEMYFFSSKEFLVGQSIVVEFQVPKRFLMNATIVFCRNYNLRSRVISSNRLPFRIGIKFSYLKEGERTILRNFVHSIEPNVEVVEAPAKDAGGGGGGGGGDAGGGGDDEFDIFDDLE